MHPLTADGTLTRALDASIDRYRADGAVPGLALAVTDREGLVVSRVAGLADVSGGRPVTENTLFEVGSIGKTFTAVVILQLAREGRLDIDDPVVRHLPWFRVPRHGDAITLRHLLSHTAGITAGVDGTPEAAFQVWRLRDLPPGSAPGRRFHYSNVGYKALGLVIAAIEGESYPEVIRRRILEPLAMAQSEPAITNDIRHRLAVGYGPVHDDRPWTDGDALAPATWLETDTADGSVAATGPDLATFVHWLMTDETGLVAQMATPVEARAAYGYGMALLPRLIDGRRYVGHGGGMVGYLAGMQWDPEAGLGAVVLQNGPIGNPNSLARLAIRQVRAARDGRDPAAEQMEGPTDLDEPLDQGAAGPGVPDMEQAVLVGTYRSHDPWIPVFAIEARGPELWLTFPEGPDGFENAQPLLPMARGWFRVGADRLGPERMRFDTVIDGRARRAWLSGWDYYRIR